MRFIFSVPIFYIAYLTISISLCVLLIKKRLPSNLTNVSGIKSVKFNSKLGNPNLQWNIILI